MAKYIGIDIGGTNIRVGVLDENEEIVYLEKASTLENVTTDDELYNKIKKMVLKVPSLEEADYIGIGVPGAVRDNNILTCRNVPFLKNYPLAKKLEEDLKKKVHIENDAKVAALGVSLKGKMYSNVCYITLSTGLGGGVVIDKEIFRGANNVAGYFSRMILDGENIAENLISGTALRNLASKVYGKEILHTKDVFDIAKSNKDVENVICTFKKNLVNLLLNISITLNPDIIILGGGVIQSHDYFLDEVKQKFKEKAHSFARNTIIKTCEVDEPGVIGAALIGKKY